MSAPAVTASLLDLSQRVPGFPGVYGAIAIPAVRGPIDRPVLVTSSTQLKALFTPKGVVGLGYDLSYYSALAFLQQSETLWVKRAIQNDYLYGGASFFTEVSDIVNNSWGEGQNDPTAWSFGASEAFILYGADPGFWNNDLLISVYGTRTDEAVAYGSITNTGLMFAVGNIDSGDGSFNTTGDATIPFTTGTPLQLSFSGFVLEIPEVEITYGAPGSFLTDVNVATGTLMQLLSEGVPAELISGGNYYAINVDSTHFKLATNAADASAGNALAFSAFTTGVTFTQLPQVPPQLSLGTVYYGIQATTQKLKLATSPANALANVYIPFSPFGSGIVISSVPAFSLSQSWVSGEEVRLDGPILPTPLDVNSSYWLIAGSTGYFLANSFSDATAGVNPIPLSFPTGTFANSEISTNSSTLTVASSIPTGTPIEIVGGSLPAPLVTSTIYYAIRVSPTRIRLAPSAGQADAGQYITLQPRKTETIASGGYVHGTGVFTSALDWVTGTPVCLGSTGFSPGLNDIDVYFVINVDSTHFKLAATLADALAGTPFITTSAAFTANIVVTQQFQGSYNTQFGFTLTAVNSVPVANAFVILVFDSDNLNTPVERWVVSRVVGAKDGFGNNIFIEDVLQGSSYIRALNNDSISGTLTIGSQLVALPLAGGDDGSPVTDGALINAISDFSNSSSYPVTVLMDGGWATAAYGSALSALAAARQDCVPYLSTPHSAEVSENYLNALVNYRSNVLNLNTPYGGLFSPHPLIFDADNDVEINVPPDGYAAAAVSFSAANYEMWFPAAGFKRGNLNVLDLSVRFSDGERDYLYDNGINAFRFYPGKGIIIWGQKTLQSTPSDLDRLNVVLLTVVLIPAIKTVLETFLWELNDDDTRASVVTLLSAYLTTVVANRGLYDFDVVCDKTNNQPSDIDNYIMNVWVFIKPEKSTEYIPLKLVLTSTGVSFTSAAAAL